MRVLNLFAGLGGNRTLWTDVSVVAVELDERIAQIYQKRFPNDEVIIQDAFEYLRTSNLDFDLIWASPPCQTHSQMMKFYRGNVPPVPQLQQVYGLKIWFDWYYDGYYVIENVQPYYVALIPETARVDRHLFWSNFPIESKRFRKKRRMHGRLSLSHVMRDSKEKMVQELMLEDVDELITDQERRNCVDPRIGLYILDQFRGKKIQQLLVL